MRECELYPAARDWLIGLGYEVHVEVFGTDVVGVRGDILVAVELKRGLTDHLIRQLLYRRDWADIVVGFVPSARADARRTEKIASAEKYGLGIAAVGSSLEWLIQPQQQTGTHRRKRYYRFRQLRGRAPAMEHELAGLPSCPALKEQRERRWRS